MTPVYLVPGISLLLVAVVDALWTTLWVDGGAGPVSSRLTTRAYGWSRLEWRA